MPMPNVIASFQVVLETWKYLPVLMLAAIVDVLSFPILCVQARNDLEYVFHTSRLSTRKGTAQSPVAKFQFRPPQSGQHSSPTSYVSGRRVQSHSSPLRRLALRPNYSTNPEHNLFAMSLLQAAHLEQHCRLYMCSAGTFCSPLRPTNQVIFPNLTSKCDCYNSEIDMRAKLTTRTQQESP